MDPLIVLFGFGVGILVGTTGMGGGSIMTPLLILVFGTKPVVAIGTDLAYAAVTKTVGGWRHFRQGTVDMKLSSWLAVGSIPGALVGVYLLDRLHRSYGDDFDTLVLTLIAAALLLSAAAVLARSLFFPEHIAGEQDSVTFTRGKRIGAVTVGLIVGCVLGVTSAGSGALIAIALILLFRLTPRRVVGTDVFHAALLLWVASAAHIASGNVDFGLAGNILIGSVPGVWIGSNLTSKLPEGVLRPTLGVVLTAAGLGLLSKAGLSVPPAVLIGGPAGLAILVAITVKIVKASRTSAVDESDGTAAHTKFELPAQPLEESTAIKLGTGKAAHERI